MTYGFLLCRSQMKHILANKKTYVIDFYCFFANKAGANFKFIPGCEMYVHPNLETWNLDYEIRKAAKKWIKKEIKNCQ